MTKPSTDRLVEDLVEFGAPEWLVADARAFRFHDYKSPSEVMPIVRLVELARKHGLDEIAARAIDGAYDATKEESDEWARSPEGREVLSSLPPGMRKVLE